MWQSVTNLAETGQTNTKKRQSFIVFLYIRGSKCIKPINGIKWTYAAELARRHRNQWHYMRSNISASLYGWCIHFMSKQSSILWTFALSIAPFAAKQHLVAFDELGEMTCIHDIQLLYPSIHSLLDTTELSAAFVRGTCSNLNMDEWPLRPIERKRETLM